jgi:DNA-directed RNA polymerase specialized sigma24 family protein
VKPTAAERSSGSAAEVAADDRRAWIDDVTQKLDALTEPQVAALRLVYANGLLQSEAATRMGLTPQDLSVVVAQGLRRLGQLLAFQALAGQVVGCQPALHPSEPERFRRAV